MTTPSPGIVVFYLPDKGYGYLRLAGTREEFHFRKRNLRSPSVKKGDLVRFLLREGPGGYYADAIELTGIT
ncbi:cold shock CspA family protein [Lewinella aquimaris]|uniref:Cold shock CspA family protein n=1 Tax=Neolewinella aquimaris TaxID=1835722 RepID=A0A840EFM2_9BACT|nr:hypothetical protein [Neolewinella aquimaris]MBB4079726.1 cold shock CspA family protein [Neolewinella aquimaris]